jgi:hypothetical protein
MQDMVLGDLNFVTKQPTDPIAQLGYTGQGWQHRVQTEWLLHVGVIDLRDFSHKLTATGRLPADLLKKPLERMERAWEFDGLGKQSCSIPSTQGVVPARGARYTPRRAVPAL